MRPSLPVSLVLALASACASAPVEPLSPLQPVSTTEFAHAAALLDGFTAPMQRNEWRLGESVLYGLRLEKGAALQRWLVRLTLADNTPGTISSLDIGTSEGSSVNFMSPNYVYRVEVYDPDGRPLGDSRINVPYDFLRYDFTQACADSRDPPIDPWKTQRIAGAFAALISFLRILQADDLLSSILWQVVDKPSVWSVLTGFGVSASLSAELKDAIDLPSPLPAPWNLPAVRFPLVLRINGTDALHTEITATSPHVPMRMGAGIVQITGVRPSDPRIRFAASVLAATSP